jgi:predicted nucleotidyltransferase
MIEFKEIDAYAKNVAAKFRPYKIILFGSYADDSANEDSDVDLLVIVPHQGRRPLRLYSHPIASFALACSKQKREYSKHAGSRQICPMRATVC